MVNCKDNEIEYKEECIGKNSEKIRKLYNNKKLNERQISEIDCNEKIFKLQTGRCVGIQLEKKYEKLLKTKKPEAIKEVIRNVINDNKKGFRKSDVLKILNSYGISEDNIDDSENYFSDMDNMKEEANDMHSNEIKVVKEEWGKKDENFYQDIKDLISLIDKDILDEDSRQKIDDAKIKLTHHKKEILNDINLVNQHNELMFDFYKSARKIEDKDNSAFSLQPSQKFVKKFISPFTGNTGILLFHKLGSGKTCSALQIGLNFLDFFDKKILVIGKDVLHYNFRKEIFDYSALSEDSFNGRKSFNGCIGNNLMDNIIPEWRTYSKMEIRSKMKYFIDTNFEFNTPGTISKNIYDNYYLQKIPSEDKKSKLIRIQEIKRIYSNRVIIVDEAHNLRVDKKGTDKQKKVTKTLFDIMTHASNVRLVLLSATPMYNEVKDIYDIMDLLMQNDKTYENETIETKSKNERVVSDEDIEFFSKNYVSYLSGNYTKYPIKVNPSMIMNASEMDKVYYVENDKRKQVELYRSDMSELQLKALSWCMNNNDNNKKYEDDEDDEDETKVRPIHREISNFCPPTFIEKLNIKNDCYDNISYETFVKNHFEFADDNKQRVIFTDKEECCLSKDNIDDYAPKIKSMIDCIDKSQGLCLIYSEFVDAGALPICAALEKYGGYQNYYQKNNEQKKNVYVYLSAKSDKGEMLQLFNSEKNINGNIIKVCIIGSSFAEGVDFKNIREIHILDPWWHLQKINQIIGRGIRYKSHDNLRPKYQSDEDKYPIHDLQNTTVYLHCNINMEKNVVKHSPDYEMYKRAITKQYEIARITRIIKKNALDCNAPWNIRPIYDYKVKIKGSNGKEIKEYDINEKDYSFECDFDKCEFECSIKVKTDMIENEELNEDLLFYEAETVRNEIIEYFKTNNTIFISVDAMKENLQYKNNIIDIVLKDIDTHEFIMNSKIVGKLNIIDNSYLVFIPNGIENKAMTFLEHKNLNNNDYDKEKINFHQIIDETNFVKNDNEDSELETKEIFKNFIVMSEQVREFQEVFNLDKPIDHLSTLKYILFTSGEKVLNLKNIILKYYEYENNNIKWSEVYGYLRDNSFFICEVGKNSIISYNDIISEELLKKALTESILIETKTKNIFLYIQKDKHGTDLITYLDSSVEFKIDETNKKQVLEHLKKCLPDEEIDKNTKSKISCDNKKSKEIDIDKIWAALKYKSRDPDIVLFTELKKDSQISGKNGAIPLKKAIKETKDFKDFHKRFRNLLNNYYNTKDLYETYMIEINNDKHKKEKEKPKKKIVAGDFSSKLLEYLYMSSKYIKLCPLYELYQILDK